MEFLDVLDVFDEPRSVDELIEARDAIKKEITADTSTQLWVFYSIIIVALNEWITLAEFLEDFLFEFNDATTRALVTSRIDSYMQNIKNRRGVYDYRVVCSEENNTIEEVGS